MPGLDDNNDDASAVIVATKNLSEEKYNEPMTIPQGLFDTDTAQTVNIPKKPKKNCKKIDTKRMIIANRPWRVMRERGNMMVLVAIFGCVLLLDVTR